MGSLGVSAPRQYHALPCVGPFNGPVSTDCPAGVNENENKSLWVESILVKALLLFPGACTGTEADGWHDARGNSGEGRLRLARPPPPLEPWLLRRPYRAPHANQELRPGVGE